ncbi:SMP-30/gluconolactonase/LRE family protein [Cucumibacter marinus]|uniref:SMP-30/gluconolactonase/LRE family protein n=1 Tax=Cucumibacter marinus TaxID=1121252 RepID=UPI000421BC20|nr:SMP-30/gluconolactonase/LRE family protein [Cucumibacter marinus]
MGLSAAHLECIQQANATLGEGPVWDWRTGNLFWVDIRRGYVFRHHLASGEQTGQWVFDERVGAVALTADPGRILVAAGLTVYRLDLESGDTSVLCVVRHIPKHRFNDGEVDAMGRLWMGTMHDDYFAPSEFTGGLLHRIDPDGTVTEFGKFQLPNGIGWSLDKKTMYVNDSAAGTTQAFDFDLSQGIPTNQRTIYTSPPGKGMPDGMSVDAEGNIWCAMWDGWSLIRLSPEGEELDRYPMPVRRPSSATFCGESLDQLAITSATVGFTSQDYIKSPRAGGLFLAPAGCSGQRPNLFGVKTDAS